ncbi:MAG TPA: T9SS type A sorting domain-containing protein [Ferruginibacter sp.]|nr:T9SS type A sorting domain-containing protein [Ferruginibacter sp.]HRE63444.1 T9SS type A sorting domain-containing protein [Ferruginibacter sp.]
MKPFTFIAFLIMCLGSSAQIIDPGLTAVYEHHQHLVKLKWHHNDNRVHRFILQRSEDGNKWTDVFSIRIQEPEYYQFISYEDVKLKAGKSFYRLQAVLANNSFEFTKPIVAIIGQKGNNWLMYPQPVSNVLNLQYNGNAIIPGVITVFIQRINGQMYHQLRYASSTRFISIPVSNLGSGMYIVRIIINKQEVWNKKFVK